MHYISEILKENIFVHCPNCRSDHVEPQEGDSVVGMVTYGGFHIEDKYLRYQRSGFSTKSLMTRLECRKCGYIWEE